MLPKIKKLEDAPFTLQMAIGVVSYINVWIKFFNEEYALLNKKDTNRSANATHRANMRFNNVYEKNSKGYWESRN